MAHGSILLEKFIADINALVDFSRATGGCWCKIQFQDGSCYAVTKKITPYDRGIFCDEDTIELECQEDDACVQEANPKTALSFEYHILFSESYGVPVLYFNAHKQDGALLSLDEIWNFVPESYKDRLESERWTFITQKEHPILQRPFFQLHPCHTETLMKNCPNKTGNYVVTWLSAVGPVVGLDLPLKYAELCNSNELNKETEHPP